MIIQSAALEKNNDISFTISQGDLKKTLVALEKVRAELGAEGVTHESNVAKVAIVGVGMRSHPGVAARMFKALADKGINLQMISTSEIKISCIISKDQVDRAVRTLHDEFELGKKVAKAAR